MVSGGGLEVNPSAPFNFSFVFINMDGWFSKRIAQSLTKRN